MRIFLAVPLAREMKAELRRISENWPGAVAKADFHLTVVFLGEVEAYLLPGLIKRVNLIVAKFAPLHLNFQKIENLTGKVCWARFRANAIWQGLVRELRTGLQFFCRRLLAERRSIPHVTLVRNSGCIFTAKLSDFAVKRVEVWQSQLGGPGARYQVLASFPLRGLTEFARRVYAEAQKIPRGQVATYAEVARRCGRPHAARAVGQVLKRNFDPQIPCQRVVRANGSVGGWNRGPSKKVQVLRQEGVRIRAGKVLG